METMKKIIIALLCAAVMISCGNSKEKANNCSGNNTECTDGCNNNNEGCGGDSHKANAGCIKIDTETFINKVADIKNAEWKYLGDKPAIVDFYADWCAPCKMIAPSLEEIAAAYGDKIYVYKINVDEAHEIAEAFNISAIPTLLFIPMEGKAYKNIGYIEKEQIEKLISEHLLK